jgi:hypothetical protein
MIDRAWQWYAAIWAAAIVACLLSIALADAVIWWGGLNW